MSYDVSFKAKLEGLDKWVYVGKKWINYTSNVSTLIKEVCGYYPTYWNGKCCSDVYPAIQQGIELLTQHPQMYRQFEPANGWGSVEGTLEFLKNIADVCREYPVAIIEVEF